MVKLIWISDLHFKASGDVLGHDPRARLSAVIARINAHHADAAFCVLSGDTVHEGTAQDYAQLHDLLSELSPPYYPLVGNHDTRALFRETLPMPEGVMPEFVQYQFETPEGIVACLDTLQEGSSTGAFCPERFAWLRAVLTAAGDRQVYLFMHHPPLALGLPAQDPSKIAEGDALLDLLAEFPNVAHLFMGHVHRQVSGSVRGIPFAALNSALFQAPPPRPAWDWDSFQPVPEAPKIGVVTLAGRDVTIQYEEFCSADMGITPQELV